jgi:peroxiredoxin
MATQPTVYVDVGDQIPDITLSSLSGEQVSLASLRGKKHILFMWASW